MPFLNKQERDLVKKVLADVMTDADLKSQFNNAKKRKDQVQSDYTDGQLGQYMGILKEIQDERAAHRATPRTGVVQGPSLEQLKKKFLGPNHKG